MDMWQCCCSRLTNKKGSVSMQRQSSDTNLIIEHKGQPRWRYHLKRYTALILWCIIGIGLVFCYDIPGSLQNRMMEQYNIGPYEFSYVYSAYCWPSCVMCLFSGYLIDRYFGVVVGVMVYVTTAVVGQALIIVADFQHKFYLLLLGRFIFGVGSEASLAALNNYAVLWFRGKELNMVLSTLLNVARVGSSITFEASEPTYHAMQAMTSTSQALSYTILILGSMIVIPLICSLLVALFNPDVTVDKPDQEKQPESMENATESLPKLSDVVHFPLKFWLLVIYSSVLISSCYSFTAQAQALFTQKFDITNETANRYTSFFNIFGAALSPCLGYSIDKLGRHLSYIVLSCITGTIGYGLVAFTQANPFISMVFLAVAMTCVFAATWGMYSFIIPENQQGTAFGIAQAGMNIFLSIGTVLLGAIASKLGFQAMNAFLMAAVIITSVLVVWCWVLDRTSDGILNMSATERLAYFTSLKVAASTNVNDGGGESQL